MLLVYVHSPHSTVGYANYVRYKGVQWLTITLSIQFSYKVKKKLFFWSYFQYIYFQKPAHRPVLCSSCGVCPSVCMSPSHEIFVTHLIGPQIT